MKPDARLSSSTPPPASRSSARAGERGYVLFIVLIVGVAAGIAAMSLSTTRGYTELSSIHAEVGDRSQVIAEAGMQRAIFFLTDRIRNEPDFDSVLDVGLDKACGGAGTQLPDPDDARPPIGTDPMEWNDPGIAAEVIGGKHYTCVPFGGGRYCVRFEDDDDDGIFESAWDRITGNNEDGAGGCDPNGCLEGPAPGQCPSHNNGQHNGVRDRNRAIWVMSIGIYPNVPYAEATHKTTLRRYHVAPLVPSNAGLRIKGHLTVGSGGGGWYACSDVGGVEIDGKVKHAGVGCTSGVSFADDWNGSALCADDPARFCGKADWDGLGGIAAIGGGQYKPGPHIDAMPDVWNQANQWIDFTRECVFWVEWGSSPASPPRSIQAKYPGSPNADTHQLWWWDADERRGPRPPGAPQPLLCSEFETIAGPNARMPGPPNPARAGQPGNPSDPDDWAGCWSPLIIDGMQFDLNDVWLDPALSLGLTTLPAFHSDEIDCWTPPFRRPTNPMASIPPERPLYSGPCAWLPHQQAGVYDICTGGPTCGPMGRSSGILSGKGPLNLRLSAEGMPEFPMSPPMRISKPNWADCTVSYPPPNTVIDGFTYGPTDWSCTTCDGSHPVLQDIGANGLWFKFQTHADVTATPAGVYFFSNGIRNLPTGSSIDWNANAATPPGVNTPWDQLSSWPLTTVMTDGEIKLQRGGFTWGIGQTHPGPGNDGADSPWARYASWIVGGRLTLQGGGSSATAGSVYAGGGAEWAGNGKQFVFGQLFSNGDFKTTGAGEFFWIYRVDLGGRPAVGGAGLFPSQSPVSQ